MAYIGKQPIVGNFQVCDAISVVNGQAAYTMQVASTNVEPETANHMLVSLNGILQKPGSSFTISGSTITFASNLATGDVIDFIILLGDVLNIGAPSDSTVTDAKANFVSTSSGAGLQIKGDGTTDGTLQLNCSQNSHGIKLASPAHSAGQSYTLKFPTGNVTAGKVLKVDSVSGSGTTGIGQLSFGDASSDFVLLGTSTASSSASITLDGLFSSTYKNYKVVYSYLVPENNTQYLSLYYRVSSSDVSSSDYSLITDRRGNNSSNTTANDSGVTNFATSSIVLSMSTSNSASYGGASGFFYLFDPLDTSSYKLVTGQAHNFYSSTQQYFFDFAAVSRASTAALSGLKISFGSGNIASGTVKLYGMK